MIPHDFLCHSAPDSFAFIITLGYSGIAGGLLSQYIHMLSIHSQCQSTIYHENLHESTREDWSSGMSGMSSRTFSSVTRIGSLHKPLEWRRQASSTYRSITFLLYANDPMRYCTILYHILYIMRYPEIS